MNLGNLKLNFQLGLWQPASSVERPFVRHANSESSPGFVWLYSSYNSQAILSVIIPTLDAYRDGYLPELLAQVDNQDFPYFEIILVRGDPLQGRAINVGASLAQGKYLLTLDDDTALPDPQTFSKLVAVMEAHPEIGIAGGNNVIPTYANPFVQRVMRQIPRRSWEPVAEITDSDLAEHPCMIMRTDTFRLVGGENELIPRGLDPYLRQEFRNRQKRVVVVPGVIYHHLPPDNIRKLLRQFHRNGRQARYVNRHYQQWVFETPPTHGPFRIRVAFSRRILRFVKSVFVALITGKLILFVTELSYMLGFIQEWLFPNNKIKKVTSKTTNE
jgi:glycosyltransferase involved in cell wall biosynthesis